MELVRKYFEMKLKALQQQPRIRASVKNNIGKSVHKDELSPVCRTFGKFEETI